MVTPWVRESASLYCGDCLQVMPQLAENSFDSIVCDPPYGLTFMGKDWDRGVPGEHFWREAFRVAKPGAFLLAFGGTRTYHRLACAIEDAGWELRDCIYWVYGSGFPKSLDVSKQIDKEAGAEREVIGTYIARGFSEVSPTNDGRNQWAAGEVIDKAASRTAPATDAARQWSGFGTALKPAVEPIILARKPLEKGLTVAQNVMKWGTGCLNIDGCRVDSGERPLISSTPKNGSFSGVFREGSRSLGSTSAGRWPANLIHDGSDEVAGMFPQTNASTAAPRNNGDFKSQSKGAELAHVSYGHDDSGGSAARFFYSAKASKQDREDGLEIESRKFLATMGDGIGGREHNPEQPGSQVRNHHPTVKPTSLMRYLCKLATRPGGLILDPFTGSGPTGKAAILEGFSFCGIELSQDYIEIAKRRIFAKMPPPDDSYDDPDAAPPKIDDQPLLF